MDHFLEPVFELNNEKNWHQLLSHLEEACNNPETIAEDPTLVLSACEYARRQMVHNEEVVKILKKNYTYQTPDGYGINPQVNSNDSEVGESTQSTVAPALPLDQPPPVTTTPPSSADQPVILEEAQSPTPLQIEIKPINP